MEIFSPREIMKDGVGTGKWHFTYANSKGVATHRCCADCPGHDSADLAYEHYLKYVSDHAQFAKDEKTQKKCEVCGEWTSGIAYTVGHMPWHGHFCPAHQSAEHVFEVLKRQCQERIDRQQTNGSGAN